MANTIKLKRKVSGIGAPLPSDLAVGEPALNTYEGKLFIKDNDEIIVDISATVIDVTTSDSKFFFNGIRPDDLVLQRGQSYVFRCSDSATPAGSFKIGSAVE